MCVHFLELWSFENYTSKFWPHLRHKILCPFSPSPSTHLLLPSRSYPWLPIVVSFFLTHLLLEVASPIIFLPSPFLRSKGLHWWRRSKAYKLHKELHHNAIKIPLCILTQWNRDYVTHFFWVKKIIIKSWFYCVKGVQKKQLKSWFCCYVLGDKKKYTTES